MTDVTSPAQRRHDELVALLTEIRERLPLTESSVNDTEAAEASSEPEWDCSACGEPEPPTGHTCPDPVPVEPAPAGDLPGEPVEPGDLRAGDKVGFTWELTGERITCHIESARNGVLLTSDAADSDGYYPNVAERGLEWCVGISDVRLIERAPRQDEDPDEALAMDLYHASLQIPPVKEVGPCEWPSERDHELWLGVARAARANIEAEWEEVAKSFEDGRDKWQAAHNEMRDRAEKAEADLADMTRQRNARRAEARHADAQWAEAEGQLDDARINAAKWKDEARRFHEQRDEWQARHQALREDVEQERRGSGCRRIGVEAILDRDTERGAR